jgi:hypothetical protein
MIGIKGRRLNKSLYFLIIVETRWWDVSGYSSESDVWDRPAYDIVGTEVTVIV